MQVIRGDEMTTGPYGDEQYQGYPQYPGQPQPGYPSSYPAASLPGDPAPTAAAPTGYPTQSYPAPAYPAPAYPPPYYAAPQYATPRPRNGMGTAALVLGIIGVALFWTISIAIVLGILAIIFGGVGMARARQGIATNRGPALTGLVLGIVALLAPFLLIVFSLTVAGGLLGVF